MLKQRRGFAALIMIVLLLIIVLKLYIVYRVWNLAEESARKQQGLPPAQTPIEWLDKTIRQEIEKQKPAKEN